jgi:hypothetical protein
MSKHLAAIVPTLFLAASAFFFWVWYERYLRRDFNELGRHYDADNQIVYTDAGFVWVLPACVFLLLALVTGTRGLRRWRARKAPASTDA